MKKYIKILFLLLISFGLKAQTLPAGLPNPKSPTSYYWIGWLKADSGIINALRNTSFTPLYAGTQVFQIRPGVDSLPWWWTGQRWITFPTTGGGSGNFNSFSFTNQNGITGTVTGATGPNVALALGTSLNGIVKANGTGFGTVVVGSGLTYDGTTLSAGTNINALISGNGTNFIATTIGAGLSYSTVTHTLTNTIVNNNQLINGAGYITNITGLVTAGANIAVAGNGTVATPYIISGTGGVTITGAGNLSPLFTTSVSVGTINFAFQNPAAFTIFGNPQGISAAPMYFGINSTLAFSGNILGVNASAPLNFYQTISQIDSFTFTLNTPTGRHDTVRISLPTNGFVSNLNNGLTLTGSLGQLGGPLVQNSVINGGGFSLGIQGNRFATGMGAAIASANNLTTGSDGNLFNVTGLTQINAIATTNWQNGSEISFIFTGTPILKNNTIGGGGTAPLQLAGSIDYQAAPGDYIKFQYDGAFWHEETRKLASGGGAYIFSNGITESPATRVKLGGTLTQNTTLAGAGTFWFAISGGRFQTGAGAAIVAANNLLPGNDGNQFSVTGNTQINAISTLNWQAGPHIELIFTGTPLLKNNTAGGVNTAVMLLAGSTDYQAAAGDLIGFSYDGAVWHETNRKLAGSVTNLTFNNGLTLTGTTAQWGGTLIQNTTITQNAFKTTFGATGTNIITANLSGVNSGVSSAVTINNPQTNSGSSSNYGMQSTAQNGGALTVGGSFVGLIGTGAGTAMGIISRGDTYGVQGTGNIGIVGFPTAGSGQAGIKGDGSANSVTGLWGVGNPGVFGQGLFGGAVGVYGQSTTIPLLGENQDPTNNTVTTALQLNRSLAPVPAVGLGISIDYSLQTNTLGPGSGVTNRLTSQWVNATDGSQSSKFTLSGVTGGTSLTPWVDVVGAGATFYGTGVAITALQGVTGIFTIGTSAGAVLESPLVPVQAANTSTSTNTVVTTFLSSRQGSAYNGAAGSGSRIAFDLKDNTGAGNASGYIQNVLTDPNPGTLTTQYKFSLINSGVSKDVLILDGNGNVTTSGGYINHIVNTSGGTYTITAFDWTVIATGTTSTWTFPTAVSGRVLNLVNNGSGAITYGTAITTGNGATTTTSAAGNRDQIQYDGTVWRKINSMNDMMALMLTLGLLRPLFKRKSFHESVYNKAA